MYNKNSSNALTKSEKKDSWRKKNDFEKSKLASKYLKKNGSILEIGCGTGQILNNVKTNSVKVGLDYSSDRIKKSVFKKNIAFIKADVKQLPFADGTFDNILMSHFYHELIQFEKKQYFDSTLKKILSKLNPKGRIIIIDHCDPGDGISKLIMNKKNLNLFKKFKKKFNFYRKDPVETDNVFLKRNLQNFITKIWSINSGAEKLEMNEDHTILDPLKIFKKIKRFNLKLIKIEKFGDLKELVKHYGISNKKTNLFKRQFCLVMEKK